MERRQNGNAMRGEYDVAIIGAGPAGSVLAFLLAQSGIRVVVLDKERFPRRKVCAGGLPTRARDIIPFDISPVIEREIFNVTLTHPSKPAFTKSYHRPLIYTVDRSRFDHFLIQRAEGSGVDLLESQKITEMRLEKNVWIIETQDGPIESALLVGADGANSIVARKLSLKPSDSFHNGLQVEVPIKLFQEREILDRGIVLDWGRFEDSYGWIFPKQESVSVGVQGPLKMGRRLKEYLNEILSRHGIPLVDLELTGHLIPHRLHRGCISREKALLVGDAAGLVDYWTGEGIFYAIRSSHIAAETIKALLSGRITSFNQYECFVNREIASEIETSYQFSRVFNHLSGLAFSTIRRYDYPWDIFCRVMRGDRTFSEIKKRFRPPVLFSKLIFKSRRGGHGKG